MAATALFAAVASGDAAAQRVADRVTGHLVTALVWMAATLDPELIVLAGGVPSTGTVFLDVIRDQISHRAARLRAGGASAPARPGDSRRLLRHTGPTWCGLDRRR